MDFLDDTWVILAKWITAAIIVLLHGIFYGIGSSLSLFHSDRVFGMGHI